MCLSSMLAALRTGAVRAVLSSLALCFAVARAPAQDAPPNLVVIMADDLGYGDIGCQGAMGVETPHIDALAAEGLRFTSGYCSSATCTPTRYSFLTGRWAFREKRSGIAPPLAPAIITPGTPTIASVLQRAGYATAVIGKWHLGLGDPTPDWNGEIKPGPLEIGFDHCFLLPTTNDRIPSVYVEDHRVPNLDPEDPILVTEQPGQPNGKSHRDELKMDWSHGHNQAIHNGISRIGWFSGGEAARWRDEDLAIDFVDRAKRWIAERKDERFFLFFASHDIHVPRMPNERFQGQSAMSYRGDAIVELDWSVGQIIAALREHGLAENTLVVFCSDNGPVLDDGYQDGAVEELGDHRPAGPYNAGKYSPYEGGTRTPFIAWWPGRIAPGVSEQVVNTIDLAHSFAALVGEELRDDEFPDSQDVLGALLGVDGAEGRSWNLEEASGRATGLRMGRWKFVDWNDERAKGSPTYQKEAGYRYALYDLEADPGETRNLYDEEPEVTARMQARLAELKSAARTR